MRFTEREIQEALCERHTAAIQEKLNRGRVAIAGLGGLGSNIAFSLARIGTGHLHLIDFDRVDLTNLNRQQFWPRHVGMPKVEALRELLLELNPAAQVETLQLRLTTETMPDVVRSCPLWLEALDGAQDKRLFVETVMAAGLRVASASGMGGYGREPLGRRRLGRLVVVGDFATDVAEAAPLAPRVTEAAALLADAALTWILE